jgi:hypothetical protein
MKSIVRFWLVCFIAFILLVPSVWVTELMKLPVLWQHYQKHKKEDKKLFFLDYLALHYGRKASAEPKSSSNEHERLPFKKMIQAEYSFFIALVASNKSECFIEEDDVLFYFDKKPIFSTSQHLPIASVNRDIWQPPKNKS